MPQVKPRVWSRQEVKTLKQLYNNSGINAICDVLGITYYQVNLKIKELGLDKLTNVLNKQGRVKLVYKDEVVQSFNYTDKPDFVRHVTSFYSQIKPAMLRCDKIAIEVELD